MDRRSELLMLAAKRAEQLSPPIDGNFLREHGVTSDEIGTLSNDVAVALAAYAYLQKTDIDLCGQVMLVGALALSDTPEAIMKMALDNLKMSQITPRMGHK